jgi:putative membrane protein
MMMGAGWVTGLVFLLLFVLLIGGLAAVAVWAFTRQSGTPSASRQQLPSGDEDSLELLRRRYARGEISREEFLAMREDLES